MASKTTNYNLHKISLTDAPPDITVLNENWDKIDTELKDIDDKASNHEHDAGDITSGILPVSRGGTGASDLSKIKVGNSSWADYANYPGMHDCSNTDFNTLKKSGIYFGYTGMTNAAFNEISVLEVIQYSNDWLLQRQTRLNDGKMFFRTFRNGDTWSNWNVINTSKHQGYTYGTTDLTAGSSALPTGQLHFVYE